MENKSHVPNHQPEHITQPGFYDSRKITSKNHHQTTNQIIIDR
jgi:hypothetical protein